MKTIAILAPHPDDETLGCGGTISRKVAEGCRVHWVVMTRMEASPDWPARRAAARRREIAAVAKFFRFAGVHELPFAPASLDQVPLSRVVASLGSVLDKVRPAELYVPHAGDAHSDHRVAFAAAAAAAKGFRRPYVRSVLAYETVSETGYAAPAAGGAFEPQVFVDVSRHFGRKLKAFSLYKGEGGPIPFPRSRENIRALARLRGAMSGVAYAEAFQLVREFR